MKNHIEQNMVFLMIKYVTNEIEKRHIGKGG